MRFVRLWERDRSAEPDTQACVAEQRGFGVHTGSDRGGRAWPWLPTPLPLSHVPSQPLFQNPESSRRSQGALSPRPAPRWLMQTPSPSGSSQRIPHIPVSGPETPLWQLLTLGTRGGSSPSPSRPPSPAPLFSMGCFPLA